MSRIRLTVDEIAMKGIDGSEGRALIDGLKGELARVLADPATRTEWARAHRTPVRRLPSAPIAPGASGARRFGRTLAHAIGKGLEP